MSELIDTNRLRVTGQYLMSGRSQHETLHK